MSNRVKEYRADDGSVLRGQPTSLTQLLTEFRRLIECEAGEPIEDLKLNAALLLSDLCCFLGLSEENRHQVLGPHAVGFVYGIESQRISLKLNLKGVARNRELIA